MNSKFKNLFIAGALVLGFMSQTGTVNAEIECPIGWIKKVENSVVVCVAQDQTQNNVQTQTVTQNVSATGGSSSSSSSSSSNTNVVVNSAPAAIPQVVYTAPTTLKQLPKTGLPEAGMALSALLPAGFALKKYGFKKTSSSDSASSIWMKKQSH